MRAQNRSFRISKAVLFRGAFYLGGDLPSDPGNPDSPDGRARVLNQPAVVRVRVLERRTMALVADVRSGPDGTWRVERIADVEYIVLGLDEAGRVNAAIQDWVRPAPMVR